MNVAAILYEGDQGELTDALLTDVAYQFRHAGVKLAGAVQSKSAPRPNRCEMTLEDLATGQCIKTSDDRAPPEPGCRLDANALEDSVGLAASSLDPATELVIINRFGKRESDGNGFRPLIESAVFLQVPVLVGLKRVHFEAWRDFVGDDLVFLPQRREYILGWCAAAMSESAAERAAAS